MSMCTCSMHCTRSGYHESACCNGPLCDCWCHSPEFAYRRYATHENICDLCRIRRCPVGVQLLEAWQRAEEAAGRVPQEKTA